MGYLVAAGVIVVGILVVTGLAYANRADPRWRDEMPRIRLILFGQLAIVALLLVMRALDSN